MSDRSFVNAMHGWLESGSDRTPPATVDAVLLAIKTTPQERDLRIPRRSTFMSLNMRLAAAVALAAIVGVGAFAFFGGAPMPLPTAAPTTAPTAVSQASPSAAAVDTGSWKRFTSDRYGYELKYPPEWEVTPATRDWVMDVDRLDWLSPAQDEFIDGEASYQIGVHVFAVDLPSGMSGDEWIDAYREGADPACTLADMEVITVAGHEARLLDGLPCDTIAFVFQDPRMYVFTMGRENQLPLMQGFLSTVRLNEGSAGRLYTGDWTAYTSAEYGFVLGVPPGWSNTPATRAWTFGRDGGDFLTSAADAFRAPQGDVRVSAWVVPFEGGAEPEQSWETVQAWIDEYCPRTDMTSCAGIASRAEHLCVESRDCHPGLLVPFDNGVQAYFFGGVATPGGMTVVSVWWHEDAPATARYGGSSRLLEGFLETMNVWPEARKSYEVGVVWPPPSPEVPAP